jgi:hypothetical protein
VTTYPPGGFPDRPDSIFIPGAWRPPGYEIMILPHFDSPSWDRYDSHVVGSLAEAEQLIREGEFAFERLLTIRVAPLHGRRPSEFECRAFAGLFRGLPNVFYGGMIQYWRAA